jgi:subtilisin-like proprotein convertase family protein
VTIPDNNPTGVLRVGDFTSSDTIADLDICINITHDWVGDIVVTLKHVDTDTEITLIDQMGLPGDPFGCDGRNIRVLLDDEAVQQIETQCGNNPAAFGTFRPNQSLSTFDGESFGGTWEVRFSDVQDTIVGTSDGAFLWYTPE